MSNRNIYDTYKTTLSSNPSVFFKNSNKNNLVSTNSFSGNRACRRKFQALLKKIKKKLLESYLHSPCLLKKLLLQFGLVVTLAATPTLSYANPIGGQVAEGEVTIDSSDSSHTIINQTSEKAVINWQSFDIKAGEHTEFRQPSSSSTTLNRVISNNPSEIFGRMSANGNIMLINQNGILFGAGSQIDVNSLIASTADIHNQDFMDGNYNFNIKGKADAQIRNDGEINAHDKGMIALVAPNVTNNGTIRAHLGKVTLAATDRWVLDGGGLVKMVVDEEVATSLIQAGHITADGGTIHLTAAVMQDMLSTVINMSGVTQARSVGMENGEIVLYGGDWNGNVGGTIEVTGTLDTSGKNEGESGGAVHIIGQQIAVFEQASVDASGHKGGGEVLIGGDYQGGEYLGNISKDSNEHGGTSSINKTKTAEAIETFYFSIMGIPTASKLFMGSEASIDISSTYEGDAGRAILWSDDTTKFFGKIKAQGGQIGGDGGFVETSGKNILQAVGFVDAMALVGAAGTWLLDPNNITIADAGQINVSGDPDWVTDTDGGIIVAANIEAALDAGTSVTITTGTNAPNSEDGDITVSADIEKTNGGTATLTMTALDQIFIDAGVKITSTTGSLNLDFRANEDIDIADNVTITSLGGNIILNSDRDNNGSGAIEIGNGVTTTTITSGGGNITLGGGLTPTSDQAVGNGSYDAGINLNKTTINSGAGSISVIGKGEAAGATNVGVYIQNGSSLTTSSSGNITIEGAGGAGTDTNYGIAITNSGSKISVDTGDVSITGVGAGSGSDNVGVLINDSALIESTSSSFASAGNIAIEGVASTSATGANAIGVWLDGSGAKITTIHGEVTITGTGGTNAGATEQRGVEMSDNFAINSTGFSVITLKGTGSDGDEGIYIHDTGANSPNELGGATAREDIILITDSLFIETGELTADTSGDYIIKPLTDSTTIGVGGGAGDLNITDAYLDSFVNGGSSVQIGSSTTSGAIDLDAYTWNDDLVINTAGAITFAGTQTLGANDVIINTNTDIGFAAGDFSSSGTFSLFGQDNTTTIGIAGGAGTINADATELGFLEAAGFSGLIFGSDTGTGSITANAYTWSKNFTINSNTGTITVAADQTMGNNDFRIDTNGNLNLNGDIINSDLTNISATINASSNDGSELTIDSNTQTVINGNLVLGAKNLLITAGTDFSLNNGNITTAGATSIDIRADNSITLSNGDITPTLASVNITLNSDRDNSGAGGILLESDSVIKSIGGNIVLGGGDDPTTKYAVGTDRFGVEISQSEVLSSGGDILIIGKGEGTSFGNYGVSITDSSEIKATSSGKITIEGLAGAGTNTNVGVHVGSGLLAIGLNTISTVSGDLKITGTGAGSTSFNSGVTISSGSDITSTGGNILITGISANGTSSNEGINVSSAGTTITNTSGNITLIGTSDGSGTSNDAVQLSDASVTTTSGDISLQGNFQGSGSGSGIRLFSSPTIGNGSTTGDITLTSDSLSWDAGGFDTTGKYILKTFSAGNDINISDTVTGGMDITSTELAYFDQTGSSGWELYAHNNILIDDGLDLTSAATKAGGFSFYADTDSSGSGIITLGDGTGSTDIGNATHTGDITLQADDIIMDTATLTTTGNYIIKTRTNPTTIGLGGAAGSLSLTDAELGYFTDGGSSIQIGTASGTGAIELDEYTGWTDDLTIQSDSGVISINGNQTSTADITISSNAISELDTAGTITLTGADITLDTLDANSVNLIVSADSLTTEAISEVADITFTTDSLDISSGALSGQGAGDSLIIQGKTNSTTIAIGTGATGTIELLDAEVTNLGTNWDSIQFGNTSTTGNIDIKTNTWNDNLIIKSDTGIITLNGAQTFNNNDFTVNTASAFDTVANITGVGAVDITAASVVGGDDITATSLTINTTGDTTIGDIGTGAGNLNITVDNLIAGAIISGTTNISTKGNLTIGILTPVMANLIFDSDNTGSATATIASIVGSPTITGGASVGNVLDITGTVTAGAGTIDFTAETITLGDDITAAQADFAGKDLTSTGTITAPIINFVNTGEITADIDSTTVTINGTKATLTGLVGAAADQDAANTIIKDTTPSADAQYTFNTFVIGGAAPEPDPEPEPSPSPSPSPAIITPNLQTIIKNTRTLANTGNTDQTTNSPKATAWDFIEKIEKAVKTIEPRDNEKYSESKLYDQSDINNFKSRSLKNSSDFDAENNESYKIYRPDVMYGEYADGQTHDFDIENSGTYQKIFDFENNKDKLLFNEGIDFDIKNVGGPYIDADKEDEDQLLDFESSIY